MHLVGNELISKVQLGKIIISSSGFIIYGYVLINNNNNNKMFYSKITGNIFLKFWQYCHLKHLTVGNDNWSNNKNDAVFSDLE